MRIDCPFCGPRDSGEFSYLGDAAPRRPTLAADALTGAEAQDLFYDYVYLRDNIAGETAEYWYHGGGCRSWLVARRDTLTHRVIDVTAAPGAGAAGGEA